LARQPGSMCPTRGRQRKSEERERVGCLALVGMSVSSWERGRGGQRAIRDIPYTHCTLHSRHCGFLWIIIKSVIESGPGAFVRNQGRKVSQQRGATPSSRPNGAKDWHTLRLHRVQHAGWPTDWDGLDQSPISETSVKPFRAESENLVEPESSQASLAGIGSRGEKQHQRIRPHPAVKVSGKGCSTVPT